ncbi:heparanase-like protein 1 [Cornus florida]|uniref:heparanase-like protein 1 n=1 Tax=Cornus florida TaxID=4283 RepID=UPI0028A14D4B|nr:heparanase-like protein 1 [Cornus florida]XP_059644838.1 heparanase-like protein 1 [Cornus florida]XP_059644839.1 heparanase-like protein 1 [Cornus florida]
MGFYFSLFLFLAHVSAILAQTIEEAIIVVNGTKAIANTDPDYVCATMDWWPREKCNYNHCPWGNSSVINLDLNHPFLAKAIQAFKPLRIRIGGSLQDQVLYDIGNLRSPCHPFQRKKGGLFGFSRGCLHMDRWDELNRLLSKTGARVTFGLNALHGRHLTKKELWEGIWDSSNACDFINYTISKGYQIDSWEFGNELSGKGIGAHVFAEQYGKDLIHLKAVISELYKNSQSKPLLVAPGGFYDKGWFDKLLQVSGPDVVNVMTLHLYNLGAGVDPHLVQKILDPHHLSEVSVTFRNLSETIQTKGPWSSAWVGESGGAFNSGGRHVSDTFVNSFWYLDQLGMAAMYSTKVYCRQTLIGGNYGLLNRTTFVPNPDYYSALLWHRLMGKEVLAVNTSSSPYLRSYAHCSKGRAGVTLLLINLSNQTKFHITVENSMGINLAIKEDTRHMDRSFWHGIKKRVAWVGSKALDGPIFREEYHLTPNNGNLRSKTVLLNGTPLEISGGGDIPSLNPVLVDISSLLYIPPLSIKFIALSHFEAKGCPR